jgi:hypothetical protein
MFAYVLCYAFYMLYLLYHDAVYFFKIYGYCLAYEVYNMKRLLTNYLKNRQSFHSFISSLDFRHLNFVPIYMGFLSNWASSKLKILGF